MKPVEVIKAGRKARKAIRELRDRIDVLETLAHNARREATISLAHYDVEVLTRDVERLAEMMDERRTRMEQLDEVK